MNTEEAGWIAFQIENSRITLCIALQRYDDMEHE